jgi:enolase
MDFHERTFLVIHSRIVTSVELFAYLGGRASVCELQEPKMIRIAGLQRADQRLNFREFA